MIENVSTPPQDNALRKTDEEIKALARSLLFGHIFTSDQCRPEELRNVFLPLALMGGDDLRTLQEEGVTFFFGYLCEAMPRSTDGKPMFTNVHGLIGEDHKRLLNTVKKMREALQAVEV